MGAGDDGVGEAGETAGVIAPPPLIYGAAVVLGLALQVIEPIPVAPVGAARVLGVLLALAGMLLSGWAVGTLRRAGTDPRPDQPTAALVVKGPYRFSRNPIYLGFTLLTAGIGVVLNAFWVLLLLAPAVFLVQKGVIEREERYLARRFGAAYARYAARVRRWL